MKSHGPMQGAYLLSVIAILVTAGILAWTTYQGHTDTLRTAAFGAAYGLLLALVYRGLTFTPKRLTRTVTVALVVVVGLGVFEVIALLHLSSGATAKFASDYLLPVLRVTNIVVWVLLAGECVLSLYGWARSPLSPGRQRTAREVCARTKGHGTEPAKSPEQDDMVSGFSGGLSGTDGSDL